MSFIAGALDFGRAEVDPAALRALVPRVGENARVTQLGLGACALVQVDLGVFGEPGWVEAPDGATVVAGHPRFEPDPSGVEPGDRYASRLHAAVDLAACLRRSRGVFASARFDARPVTLTLCGDRLGVRPLYWWRGGDRVVFASRLETVVAHPWVRRDIDEQGLVEFLSLGYALERRTPFAGVSRIGPADVSTFSRAGLRVDSWAEPGGLDGPPTPAELLDALRGAVAMRAGAGPQAAFLSGGLDSRVIVALLGEGPRTTYTYNFSPPGSQDRVFAERLAAALGTRHRSRPRPPPRTPLVRPMAVALREDGLPPEPIWSGDGGSVCLGWVYVDPPIVEAMRSGRLREAAEAHVAAHASRLPRRDLSDRLRRRLEGAVEDAIVACLEGQADPDPARRFFRFLVENDQRRHLDRHFETVLEHEVEFHLPFFDREVVERALRVPTDEGVGHGFYMRFFESLDPTARSTPWQTYPGHVPCPIPHPEESLSYQWGGANTPPDRALAGQVLRMLATGDLPAGSVRPHVVVARCARQLLGGSGSDGALTWLAGFGRVRRVARVGGR